MNVMKLLVVVASLSFAGVALARDVPDKSVPPSVIMEVRVVESEFRAALASDCAPDRCFIKGCVYENHITLDQPRDASLPGLPSEEGPGSVVAQEYLTRVRCEFTHEATVRGADVQKLARRLEKRLSRGWLTVVVAPEALEPIPKSLAKPDPFEEEPEKPATDVPPAPVEPVEITTELLLLQLWDRLLPHSPWMVAILLVTFMTLILIWAGRRLGAQSLDEKMMEAQIASGPVAADDGAKPTEAEGAATPTEAVDEEAFATAQEDLWRQRLDQLDEQEGDHVISRLLREWLKMGEYPMLARALLVFGDRVSKAFEQAPELALKKVEFASYFRTVEENSLPSRARFFRDLNQQSMASLLLSQGDVSLYRSLREDFGASGLASLMKELPARYGALLFALADFDQQHEVAGHLTATARHAVVDQLLATTRISVRETQYLSDCIQAVRDGHKLPPAPSVVTQHEHGLLVDSATALSVLLPHVAGAERAASFKREADQNGGSLPHWHEDILFGSMLAALPAETRNDLLLGVDIRTLGAWLSLQDAAWRSAFTREMTEPLQRALQQTPPAASRPERARLAQRGHREIVAAMKKVYARGGARLVELVG